MSTTYTSKILAATLVAAGLMGAASSAFADEYVSQANREQYAVSAGELHAQPTMSSDATSAHYAGTRTAAHTAPANAAHPMPSNDPYSG